VFLLEDTYPIMNNLVDSISHTEIRNILSKHGIRYRQGNQRITFLDDGMDSEYHLKQRIKEQRYNKLPAD